MSPYGIPYVETVPEAGIWASLGKAVKTVLCVICVLLMWRTPEHTEHTEHHPDRWVYRARRIAAFR